MILHVDMDAFFAAVEIMDNPRLRGRPVIVAGVGRSVVATASYEARKFGVHSAMPTAQARRLCPCGVFVPPRFSRYSEVSRKVMDALRSFTPAWRALSAPGGGPSGKPPAGLRVPSARRP